MHITKWIASFPLPSSLQGASVALCSLADGEAGFGPEPSREQVGGGKTCSSHRETDISRERRGKTKVKNEMLI